MLESLGSVMDGGGNGAWEPLEHLTRMELLVPEHCSGFTLFDPGYVHDPRGAQEPLKAAEQ